MTRVLASVKSSHRGILQVPNNLSTMIERSGMLKKDVARRKGIRPETLTRHCSGVLQFTIKDAEEYGLILGCSAQDILFAQHPIPVFGYLKDGLITPHDPTLPQEAYFMPYMVVEDDCQIIKDKNTEHAELWRAGAFYLFGTSCIKTKTIESESFMKLSVCKTKQGDVLIRVIYPGADGSYQMKHPINNNLLDMKAELIWATPVTGVCYNPPLRGATKAE